MIAYKGQVDSQIQMYINEIRKFNIIRIPLNWCKKKRLKPPQFESNVYQFVRKQ